VAQSVRFPILSLFTLLSFSVAAPAVTLVVNPADFGSVNLDFDGDGQLDIARFSGDSRFVALAETGVPIPEPGAGVLAAVTEIPAAARRRRSWTDRRQSA
jgi:hypothetical protein